MDDALGGEVANHVVGDELVVFGALEAGGDGFEGVHEAEEVFVDVELLCCFGSQGFYVVAPAELEEGFGLDGSFEMKVQLDTWVAYAASRLRRCRCRGSLAFVPSS